MCADMKGTKSSLFSTKQDYVDCDDVCTSISRTDMIEARIEALQI
jgi:hypothetical protein